MCNEIHPVDATTIRRVAETKQVFETITTKVVRLFCSRLEKTELL